MKKLRGLQVLACLLSVPSICFSQTPITSSGLGTQISGPIPLGGQTQYNITGGTRPGGGTNLFHSFGDFNVPNNNIANFLNEPALPTSNILGRVTGGNLSSIFGTLQTTGFGNANLYLINPTGFLFGPNATVNVGGMVSFTTADYLRLADGVRFNAVPNASADALLSRKYSWFIVRTRTCPRTTESSMKTRAHSLLQRGALRGNDGLSSHP